MYTVHKAQVVIDKNKLIAESSTLGLPVGEWPEFIAVLDDDQQGFLFQKGPPILHQEGPNQELGGYNYFSKDGYQLIVFND